MPSQALLPDGYDDIQPIGVVGQAQPIRISRPVDPCPLRAALLLTTAVSLIIHPAAALQRGDRFLPGGMAPSQSRPTRQADTQLRSIVVSRQLLILLPGFHALHLTDLPTSSHVSPILPFLFCMSLLPSLSEDAALGGPAHLRRRTPLGYVIIC